jgi:hypothetical protein
LVPGILVFMTPISCARRQALRVVSSVKYYLVGRTGMPALHHRIYRRTHQTVRSGIGAVFGAGWLAMASAVSATEPTCVPAESAGVAAEGHGARSEGTSPTGESE